MGGCIFRELVLEPYANVLRDLLCVCLFVCFIFIDENADLCFCYAHPILPILLNFVEVQCCEIAFIIINVPIGFRSIN